ncbi:MAG: hypothetical protein JNM70_03310 [Anaerolineae bacterium]|nr:hypothetical protein [Anaerolineae bacterium]
MQLQHLQHLQHLQLFARFAFAAFCDGDPGRKPRSLTQNGVGGTDAIAAISATKPGALPVRFSPADGDVSQNGALTPVSPPPPGTESPFRNCRNCRNCRNNPSGVDDISDDSQDSRILILITFLIAITWRISSC